ncbi:MAG: MotA/TolQ/ExbB proton channel family protein [Lentisphaeria bacterium]|nr:MotA/TolQ/ExbB proton channel family protein [Lentisphaeria bacterium]NQZ67940.1 MotA/TolQ/ExbB proton channel family protein [Lentisphaeria bacterium]
MLKQSRVILATLSLFAMNTLIFAQEGTGKVGGEAAETAATSSPGFTQIVFNGNIVNTLIWGMIFLTSIVTCAFIVDGIIQTRRDKILPFHIIQGVRDALEGGDLNSAINICEGNPSQLSSILMAGFSNIQEGYEVVQESVTAATDIESEKILQRISYLNLCGQIAPMLGLLGTVTGMVSAFGGLAKASGASKDKILAESISIALWTTVCGLLVSVPALLSYTIFKNFATRLLLESEATVLDVIKTLRGAEVDEEEEEEEYEEY